MEVLFPIECSEQFGNLFAVRDPQEEKVIGIPSLHISSVIQFQPLAEIEVFDERDCPLLFKKLSDQNSPISRRKVYECNYLLLEEEKIVHENEMICRLSFSIKEDAPYDSTNLFLRITGALLFSPQGTPYDWNEERLVLAKWESASRLTFKWRGALEAMLELSVPFERYLLKPLEKELIQKKLWFTSHNIKKRYTYWVPLQIRKLLAQSAGFFSTAITAENIFYSAETRINCSKGKASEIEMHFQVIKISLPPHNLVKPGAARATELRDRREQAWKTFIQGIPLLETPYSDLHRAYYYSWFTLFSNKLEVNDQRFPFPFTSVNKFHYYNQFFWDSAFQAIALMWHNDEKRAQDELKNFIINQWRNGMIPYELFLFPVNGREWMATDYTAAAATQPPVIAVALVEVFKKYANLDFLKFFYEPLLRYEMWLWQYRDIEKRGLSYCYHIWETGIDNSPVLDEVVRNRLLDPCLELVHFNVFLYLLRKNLIEVAKILALEPPKDLLYRIELMKESMNHLMFDEEDGFYYDLYAGEKKRIKVKTFGGLLPLITDIPDRKICDRLIKEYLMSEREFATPCPVPSVSQSEATYRSHDFWRGATWPQVTWTFVFGLKKRWPTIAAQILDKFLVTTASRTLCNEYYDSKTGEGIGLPFQGWGTLYIDFILRNLAGIEPEIDGFSFSPLETSYDRFIIKNVVLHNIPIYVIRSGKKWIIQFDDIKLESDGAIPFKVSRSEQGFLLEFANRADLQRMKISGNTAKLEIQWVKD
jgi:glycogen debranching enzyme